MHLHLHLSVDKGFEERRCSGPVKNKNEKIGIAFKFIRRRSEVFCSLQLASDKDQDVDPILKC
jgi:hypothetical protein